MKKYWFLLLFCIFTKNIHADIMDKLSEITVSNRISFHDYNWYIFSIYIDGNDLVVDVFSDMADSVSIMGYRIIDNTIRIIIKRRTWDFVFFERERKQAVIDVNYYYLIEFEEIEGKLEYYCNRIEEMNINNFIINDAIVVETTNARFGPSTRWNESIKLEEGDSIEVINIEKDTDYRPYDFWYKVIINEEIYWVFGFYIDFRNKMKIF
jgi:hypothetical protein